MKLISHCESEECVDILYVFTSSRAFLAWCLIERSFLQSFQFSRAQAVLWFSYTV